MERLTELYSESVIAKILHSASIHLHNNDPPTDYPEWVPQEGETAGKYQYKEVNFWTCGFFPGSIYSLLERTIKYPASINASIGDLAPLRKSLEQLGKAWSEPLHVQASRTNTHDLGFMIQPSMRKRWELLHDEKALATIVRAARSLYSRYEKKAGAVRSWNLIEQENVNITDMETNFLCIIDSMCNMDLLYYAAAQTGQAELSAAATSHSEKLITGGLLREERDKHREGYSGMLYSTYHVINFDPRSGEVKQRRTRQGYSDDSTWARGQSWGVLGYAQTYMWTGKQIFLDAACGLAEYFLLRMDDAPDSVERDVVDAQGEQVRAGRYVPLWDFDAPVEADATAVGPLRDSSAGVIAANGMLVLAQIFAGRGEADRSKRYLDAALKIVEDTLLLCLAPERAHLVADGEGKISGQNSERGGTFEAILKHATVNHNIRDFRRYWDHGLVYADYYLIEFGNRLLQFGLTGGQAAP